MITILISDNDLKAKEALIKMFIQEGYEFSESSLNGNIIRVAKRGCIRDMAFIDKEAIEVDSTLIDDKGTFYKKVVEDIEKPLIEHALKKTMGNQKKAARVLGLNRNTLRVKIRKLGINIARWKVV